jgi:hypothetical protein
LVSLERAGGDIGQVNVPILKANTLADPTIVTFHAHFKITGVAECHCMALCDISSMVTPGFMQGTVAVVEG